MSCSHRHIWCLILVLCLSLPALAADDFQFNLFNGKDLAGWDVTNCKVTVEDGALVLKEGNGLVRTNLKYGDFILELDWRPLRTDTYDSGIYIRSEFPSSRRGRAWPDRYQIRPLSNQPLSRRRRRPRRRRFSQEPRPDQAG
jgi:hypothetical protein